MITVGSTRKNHTHLSAFVYPGGETPRQSAKMIHWQAYPVSYRLLALGCNSKRILFLNDQRGNVVENKGPLWKIRSQSRNIYENKAGYPHKAGMLLKRKGLSSWGNLMLRVLSGKHRMGW
jgi:hypothetical protein